MNVLEYRVGLDNPTEQLVAVDVTGRRHTVLTHDAVGLFEALGGGEWDTSVWLRTTIGAVRYGALAYAVEP